MSEEEKANCLGVPMAKTVWNLPNIKELFHFIAVYLMFVFPQCHNLLNINEITNCIAFIGFNLSNDPDFLQ